MKWPAKPIGYWQLNKDHGLSDRIAFAFMFRGIGDYFDASKNIRYLPAGTTTTVVPTLAGQAARFDATANSVYDLGAGVQPLVTSNGLWTGDFTMAVMSNPIREANARHNLGPRREAGNFPQAVMIANGNFALTGATAGMMTAGVFNNPNFAGRIQHTNGVDGYWHLWVYVRRGTTYELWCDGSLIGTTTGTAYAISDSSTALGVGTRPSSGTPFRCNHNMALAMGWNRALNGAETVSFSNNPWQMVDRTPLVYKGSAVVAKPWLYIKNSFIIGTGSYRNAS